MKKVFFILLITSFSSFGQTPRVKDNFFLYKDINLLEKDNYPYYGRGNQMVKVLTEALYKGQIEATNPERDWEGGKYSHLNNTELFYGERFEMQGELYPDNLYKIRIEEERINNKPVIKNLVIILPAKENQTGEDHCIARFSFEDCEKVFASTKYKWINPSNNAHVLDYGQAIREERYRVEAVSFASLKNDVFYISNNPRNVAKKVDQSLRIWAEEESKKVMDSTRAIFSNDLLEQYFKYYSEGTFYKENKVNIPYFVKGKELAVTITKAIRASRLQAYRLAYSSNTLERMSIAAFDTMMMISAEELTAANSFYANELTFEINSEIYIYPDGKRKETIKTIDLIIPYNLSTNVKGINYKVATIYAEDLFDLLKNTPSATYYNPSNIADSCNFAEALKANKFQYSDLFVTDVYSRSVFEAFKEKDTLNISAGYGNDLNKSVFYNKQEDPAKAKYYSFRKDIRDLDSIPEFYAKVVDPGKAYYKFAVYRRIDLRKDKNKVLYRKGKELPRLLADGLREGKLKAYSGSSEDSNSVLVTDKVSINSFLKWKSDTTIYFYKDYSSMYYMATREDFTYEKGNKKSVIKKLYILNPLLVADTTYEFLLEFDYKEVVKFASKDKKLFWFLKFNNFESEPIIAEDIFGREYKLEQRRVYEKHKQLEVIE